ncbi:MAG: O-acetylserine/cysteine exporter [Legionella sp.]|nr:MAG: O-acetylserine/cysteine exporter [Legionella sp.]PJD98378.1 MAG: O-acetylserine/cysteine exporter [Legionella sp.]
MPARHLFAILLVIVVWGINFLFVKVALDEIAPLLLCALRFLLASIPAILFIKRPAVPLKALFSYGLFMFALQFSFIFVGMRVGMTPGMASLLMQVQVFFSMLFAALVFKESLQFSQILGALVSFLGIGIVALHFDNSMSLPGFLCVLCGAASWGWGNLVAKKMPPASVIALLAWSSFMICIPMLILSWLVEGPEQWLSAYQKVSWHGIGALMYIVYGSTWIGYGVWNWLLRLYPVSVMVPFTLLVPVVGIVSSVLFLGESFQLWKLIACLFVIGGLCINIFGAHWLRMKAPETA